MTKNAIDHYVTFARNPLLLAPVIESFFHTLQNKEKSILLGYLVLPVVLFPPSRNFLQNANSRSSIRSFCSDRSRLAGLPQRVLELRSTSSLAMQNLIDCSRLRLVDDLSLEFAASTQHTEDGMPNEIKAAKRLAILLEPYDVPTVYRLLGVNNL